MDPLTAISLASAILQFVEFGFKVAKRLDEFNSLKSSEVPKSLQAIAIQLPLLVNSLGKIKTESQIKDLDFDTKCILRGVVAGCMTEIRQVEEIINKISAVPGASHTVKLKMVFMSFRLDEKMWAIERNLHTYVSVLILHHVVDSSVSVPLVVEDSFFDIREKRVAPFVERPKLIKELENHLYKSARSQVQTPTVVLVKGERGTGKTQLVLEYCYQAYALGQFRTAFWLDGSAMESVCQGLEAACATIKRSMEGSRAEKLEFVKNFLSDLWHPWLLVIDNYEPRDYESIMEILPRNGYGAIIFISSSHGSHKIDNTIRVPKYITQTEQVELNYTLIAAVQNKDTEGIRDSVVQGADVNSLIWNDWPCLHRCVLYSLEEAVKFLLDRDADPRSNATCKSALLWAARQGNAAIFRMILDCEDGAGSVWKTADYQWAFDAAADNGSIEIMQMIMERSEVRLGSLDVYEDTPLIAAAGKGNLEVVRFLIAKGALTDFPFQGETALWRAASNRHFEMVKFLCEEGSVDANAKDSKGQTALYYAASIRSHSEFRASGTEMAEFLLERGADPNLYSSSSEGPLHQAAAYDHVEMLELLLQHGADIAKNADGWTVLENAIMYSSSAVVEFILNWKMDDQKKRQTLLDSALLYACGKGERLTVLQLLKAGADVNTKREKDGMTPLLRAIVCEAAQTARLLVRRGARWDVPDEDGRMALPLAAMAGFELVVKDILEKGANVETRWGENDDTLLGIAARRGKHTVVRVLLEKGADRDAVNAFDETVEDIVQEENCKEVLECWTAVRTGRNDRPSKEMS
ncbi:ankyrin 23 unc44 protein [Rutstroemia sp. NJR-2017a BBW]|nr:ankyrin 23 unc44 protein [Rutstroemia sp. NJR-2017a BBW]